MTATRHKKDLKRKRMDGILRATSLFAIWFLVNTLNYLVLSTSTTNLTTYSQDIGVFGFDFMLFFFFMLVVFDLSEKRVDWFFVIPVAIAAALILLFFANLDPVMSISTFMASGFAVLSAVMSIIMIFDNTFEKVKP